MNSTEMLVSALRGIAVQSPLLITCLVGCILIVTRWRGLGTAALPSILGLMLGGVLTLGCQVLWAVLPKILEGKPAATMSAVYTVLGILTSGCWAIAVALLVFGVCAGRTRVAKPATPVVQPY